MGLSAQCFTFAGSTKGTFVPMEVDLWGFKRDVVFHGHLSGLEEEAETLGALLLSERLQQRLPGQIGSQLVTCVFLLE